MFISSTSYAMTKFVLLCRLTAQFLNYLFTQLLSSSITHLLNYSVHQLLIYDNRIHQPALGAAAAKRRHPWAVQNGQISCQCRAQFPLWCISLASKRGAETMPIKHRKGNRLHCHHKQSCVYSHHIITYRSHRIPPDTSLRTSGAAGMSSRLRNR